MGVALWLKTTPRVVERTMTPEQIRLHVRWWERYIARTQRVEERTLKIAIAWAMGGD